MRKERRSPLCPAPSLRYHRSAFSQISDSSSADATEVFSTLDGDRDGKVTKDEMTSALQQVAAELDSQFNNMRMHGGGPGGPGGMPPPPPPENDTGFTAEELASQLEEIGDSDSQRAELISNVLENFDEADSDGDGKVTFKEAMALDQSGSDSSAGTTSTTSATTTETEAQDDVLQQILQLMQAYQVFGREDNDTGIASAFSISA